MAALWYRGRLPDPTRHHRLLAIVGARAASRVGCRRTQELAALASERGHTIVSGGALGIDAAAHRGALDAGAATFAVLGCGADVVYPDRHTGLFAEIVASGAFSPSFRPARRRGESVPVAQSDRGSAGRGGRGGRGASEIGRPRTAGLAIRMGRPLLAIPGSPGTDGLIASGKARPVSDGAELLAALAGEARPADARSARAFSLIDALTGGAPAVRSRAA